MTDRDGGLQLVPPSIADENARIMGLALARIAAPVEGGAVAFLADAMTRRDALRAAAEGDGIEVVDDLVVERDAEEAERFRIEIDRDARLPDEDL